MKINNYVYINKCVNLQEKQHRAFYFLFCYMNVYISGIQAFYVSRTVK